MSEMDYYKSIKARLEELFGAKVEKVVHLGVTSNGKFSNILKAEIDDYINIIFTFLKGKEFAPDITGFIKGEYHSDFIVAEVKDKSIKVDHIYQTKKYSDLFQSKFAFLISTHEIQEEIKRLCVENYRIQNVLKPPDGLLTLAWFNKETKNFRDWYPENPFEKDLYWK